MIVDDACSSTPKAVLVITDEMALRVGREGGLAGAAHAKT
jgi:hypothetical protein